MASTSFTKDQPAEILSDARGIRLVRLDFEHSTYGGINEILAELGEGLVTFTILSTEHKAKKFMLDPNNMTRLAVAWLAFLDDCKASEDKEKAEYQAEIDLVKERAKAIGAEMTDYAPESNYGTFNLSWPAKHPLNRFNRNWTHGNTNLSLSEVQDRLKIVEEHMAIVQTDAVENPRHISPFERQADRAGRVGATLVDYPALDGSAVHYHLTFPEDHPFTDFWQKLNGLTAGQVEYRLNYVEGVMQQQALQK